MSRLSRRTFLRGVVGGTAIALAVPPLEAMLAPTRTHADPLDAPPIFGIFYWANGLPWHGGHGPMHAATGGRDLWTPATTGAGYAPSDLLGELARHAPSIATGLEPKTEIPDSPPGQSDGHMRGFMVALTSDRIKSEGFDHPSHTLTALRPSLDQVVARDPRFYGSAPARFRSIQVGVSDARFHDYGHWNAISYNGPDSVNLPIQRPAQLWERLFAVPADAGELTRRGRLLDAVLGDASSLRTRLGSADRMRLEAHLDHLSEIQRRLHLSAGGCAAPPMPADSGDLAEKTDIMAQLLAVGLQCGLTRVFSFMLSSPATTHVFSNLGIADGMHKVCHDGGWDAVVAITRYHMHCLTRFCDVMAGSVDPTTGASLLDRMCLLGLSEYGEGWQHSVAEMPALILGGACGRLERGYHHREPGGNFAKVHVTALRALGLETPEFGFSGSATTDALPGILR